MLLKVILCLFSQCSLYVKTNQPINRIFFSLVVGSGDNDVGSGGGGRKGGREAGPSGIFFVLNLFAIWLGR